jgi:hypothetical protein
MIVLRKVARHSFPLTGTIPTVADAGEIFYLVGLVTGISLWGVRVDLVRCRHHHDCHSVLLSLQYGLVGLCVSYW